MDCVELYWLACSQVLERGGEKDTGCYVIVTLYSKGFG